jgi:hypothetical protein
MRRRVASARPITTGTQRRSGRRFAGQAPGGRRQPCFSAQRETVPLLTPARVAMTRYGSRVVSTR